MYSTFSTLNGMSSLNRLEYALLKWVHHEGHVLVHVLSFSMLVPVKSMLPATVNCSYLVSVRRQLRELKSDICKQCKKNFELEKEVRFFDQRIALLINHKISVEVNIGHSYLKFLGLGQIFIYFFKLLQTHFSKRLFQ